MLPPEEILQLQKEPSLSANTAEKKMSEQEFQHDTAVHWVSLYKLYHTMVCGGGYE